MFIIKNLNCKLCVDYNFKISDYYIILIVIIGIIIIYVYLFYTRLDRFHFSFTFQNNSDEK